MKRRIVSIATGSLLAVAGLVAILLCRNSHQACFVPIGARTGVVPWYHSPVNCAVANWTYGLGVVAVIFGTIIAILGIVVVIRDRVLPLHEQPS